MKIDKKGKIVLSEAEIRKQIRGYLEWHKVFFWHNLQGLGCYKGLPDLEGIDVQRGHFYIEIKSGEGELSEKQEEFKEIVERLGETVFVPHSYEEFVKEWEKQKEPVTL